MPSRSSQGLKGTLKETFAQAVEVSITFSAINDCGLLTIDVFSSLVDVLSPLVFLHFFELGYGMFDRSGTVVEAFFTCSSIHSINS